MPEGGAFMCMKKIALAVCWTEENNLSEFLSELKTKGYKTIVLSGKAASSRADDDSDPQIIVADSLASDRVSAVTQGQEFIWHNFEPPYALEIVDYPGQKQNDFLPDDETLTPDGLISVSRRKKSLFSIFRR